MLVAGVYSAPVSAAAHEDASERLDQLRRRAVATATHTLAQEDGATDQTGDALAITRSLGEKIAECQETGSLAEETALQLLELQGQLLASLADEDQPTGDPQGEPS